MEKNKHLASDTLNELFRLYNEGAIKPQIDSVYPFSKTGEAMQRMHNRKNIGKILLQPDSDTPVNQKATESEEKTNWSTSILFNYFLRLRLIN